MDRTDPARRADGTVGTAAHRDGELADPITAPIPRIVGDGVTGGFGPAHPSSGAGGGFVPAHPSSGAGGGFVPAYASYAPAGGFVPAHRAAPPPPRPDGRSRRGPSRMSSSVSE